MHSRVIHSDLVLLTSLVACRTEVCAVVGARNALATSSNRTIENPSQQSYTRLQEDLALVVITVCFAVDRKFTEWAS